MESIELLKAVIIVLYSELKDCEEYSLFGKIFIAITDTFMALALLILVSVLAVLEAVILVPLWFVINICHKKEFRLSYKEFFEEEFMR